MSEPKFKMGQQLWRASFESTAAWVTCPDCGGRGHIRCLLHDDTMVTVNCEGCRVGYDPPSGTVRVFNRAPNAVLAIVTGITLDGKGIEYRTADHYCVQEDDLFVEAEDALAAAKIKAETASREELERIQKKEKDTRSWSWHVHYHRKCIKQAEEQIEYHTARLNVARVKARDPT